MSPSRKPSSQPSSSGSDQPELKAPPRLLQPPSAPKPQPVQGEATTTPSKPGNRTPTASTTDQTAAPLVAGLPDVAPALTSEGSLSHRMHPIPPPSEPMQYRAIGLVRGRFHPNEDQFSNGTLTLTADGYSLPAVLLGRVLSLVKNHLNLEQDYHWVVYPRMFGKPRSPQMLTFQVMGVWEPALLNRLDDVGDGESELSIQPADSTSPLGAEPEDGYFSIRGEVIDFSEETQEVTVNIRQTPRKPNQEGKAFKLPLKGLLVGKVVGQFWDLDVLHQQGTLMIQSGARVGMVAPRKRTDKPAAKPKAYRKPSSDFNSPPREQGAVERPQPRREPFSKPVKKLRLDKEGES